LSSGYFLRSARLGFRRWTVSDLSLANGLWGDPAVTRLIGGPFTEEQIRSRLSLEMETQSAHGIQYWPIFLLATGQHVGCCGLRRRDPDRAIYEIGFHIRKAEWRKGYASEAARAVIAYAFDSTHAAALFAGHNPANESSRRLLQKLGFRFTHTEYYAPTGLDHPSYIFTRDAFAAAQKRSS
jgi:RimJ/RimL family protein N-acetyltransferase